jgi:hypothetical protein
VVELRQEEFRALSKASGRVAPADYLKVVAPADYLKVVAPALAAQRGQGMA